MFETFEETIKKICENQEQIKEKLGLLLYDYNEKTSQTHNCILAVAIFIIVNMFMTAGALGYGYHMHKKAEAATQQLERLSKSADKFERLMENHK